MHPLHLTSVSEDKDKRAVRMMHFLPVYSRVLPTAQSGKHGPTKINLSKNTNKQENLLDKKA